ncbi:putative C6 zinc finger domain-containing protein [Rosellinia necatrix]|uniref:Putative C6 zinc finger domain-containing protein n=1 Tax=Rosellinia necatrix TaxID=77044 RepID=A0A1W2TW40_ROSNE|nr:putative C6 zinc finger domain-containing protein [Rosellinia necatrix]
MDEVDLDYEIDFDAPLDADIPSFLIGSTDTWPSEVPSDAATPDNSSEISSAQGQRRYHSKRPHRKSRAGCKQCKKRKVKCDEARPTCKACTLRAEECVYPHAPPPASSSAAKPLLTDNTNAPAVRLRAQSVESAEDVDDPEEAYRDLVPVVAEPIFIPEQVADLVDMKMLWFYTTYSFRSFSVNTGRSPLVDHTLKVKMVEHAFRSPFLMETLKALSALHLRTLGQPVPDHKVVAYQARAFQGYRNAIETANPADFPALLGCSLFTIAMSSQTFRDPNGKRLFIVDWINMWRGIGLIIDLVSPQAVQDSGLATIFYRPPIDMEKTVQYIPNNLLFMVTSIKDGDADHGHQKEYYELLKYLGSLYHELIEHGFGPVLDLRIITFFSFCPRPLLPLAKQFRPRILIIIAYWLCFVKFLRGGSWWMQGLTGQSEQIFDEVGEEWRHLLRVPQMVMETDDNIQIARLIIDNHNWTPSELDLYHKHRDPRMKTDLKLIANDGAELEIAEGQWRLKETGARWVGPRIVAQDVEPEPPSQDLLIGTGLLYKAAPYKTLSVPSPADSSPGSSAPGLSPSITASRSPTP